MDKLFSLEEIQALGALFNKTPMTPAEQLWAQAFVNRLFNYVNESKVDLDTKQPEETVSES